MSDDVYRQRIIEARARLAAIVPGAATGCDVLVCQTVKVQAYPTAARAFYGLVAVDVGGQEVEGGAVTLGPLKGTFFGANLGGSIPPVGTPVVAFRFGRWVFAYG